MIFTRSLAQAVLRGRKIQTRRPVRAGETDCRYRPGGSYAIQPGRTRPAIGRIVVTHVERQVLAELTEADARAEGFGGRAPIVGFARHWLRLYDPAWREVLDQVSDEEVLERWRTRFGAVEVWAISFVLDPSADARLLHRHSERGYTDSLQDALEEEPEAIDETTQEGFTRQANDRDDERRRMVREEALTQLSAELRSITLQLAVTTRRAVASGIDVSDEMRLAVLSLRRAERVATRRSGEVRG